MEHENDALIIDNDTRLNEKTLEEARDFLEGENELENESGSVS